MTRSDDPADAGAALAGDFLRCSILHLEATYLPRLERALGILPAKDLWWQPHEGALSFGQVLRHLEGNVRQWILSGVGGQADRRERASEFQGPDERDGEALLAALRGTVEQAAAVITSLDATALGEARTIQGFTQPTLEAIYHVVEHFSWHTGQAVWIAKARAGAGHGLAFFDEQAINEARN